MALPKYQKAMAAASPKAEPKKRARKPAQSPDAPRAASSETPSKKRGKVSPAAAQIAAANVAAAKRAAIAEAIEEAQCVPTSAREMLCSSLSGCLSVTGPFHPFQERILRMLDQTLKDIQVEKARKFQRAASGTVSAKEELERVEMEHENVEIAVNVSSADAKEKENALAQSVAVLQPLKLAFEHAQRELQRGDAVIGAAAMEREQLRSARAEIGNASVESALARLQSLCSGWTLTPGKRENLTLLEGELCQRLALLDETVSTAAVARAALAASFHNVQTGLDAANEKQQACAMALARIQSEWHERVGIMKAKAQTVKQQKVLVNQKARALQIAQRSLSEFQKVPHAAFKDIIAEIEQQHGIRILDEKSTMKAEAAPKFSPESKIAAEIEQGREMALAQLLQGVIPVIDRRQRQAVIRRRSAALPEYCFSRRSLMARRSSMVANSRASMGINEIDKTSFKEHLGQGCEAVDEDSQVFNGTQAVPTPNRSLMVAGPH